MSRFASPHLSISIPDIHLNNSNNNAVSCAAKRSCPSSAVSSTSSNTANSGTNDATTTGPTAATAAAAASISDMSNKRPRSFSSSSLQSIYSPMSPISPYLSDSSTGLQSPNPNSSTAASAYAASTRVSPYEELFNQYPRYPGSSSVPYLEAPSADYYHHSQQVNTNLGNLYYNHHHQNHNHHHHQQHHPSARFAPVGPVDSSFVYNNNYGGSNTAFSIHPHPPQHHHQVLAKPTAIVRPAESIPASSSSPGTSISAQQQLLPRRSPTGSTFRCACGKMFQKLCGLKSHFKVHQASGAQLTVNADGTLEWTKANGEAVVASREEVDRCFPCEICPRTFLRKQDLRRHRSSHSEKFKRFQCENCDTTFSRSDALYRHVKSERCRM